MEKMFPLSMEVKSTEKCWWLPWWFFTPMRIRGFDDQRPEAGYTTCVVLYYGHMPMLEGWARRSMAPDNMTHDQMTQSSHLDVWKSLCGRATLLLDMAPPQVSRDASFRGQSLCKGPACNAQLSSHERHSCRGPWPAFTPAGVRETERIVMWIVCDGAKFYFAVGSHLDCPLAESWWWQGVRG